jgi:hypothetical protein
MDTVREVASLDDLILDLQKGLRFFGRDITKDQVTIKPYCYDNRIGWDTYIVIVKGHGVYGFTNGPLNDIMELSDDAAT